MIVANDGGASVSHDAGKSCTTETISRQRSLSRGCGQRGPYGCTGAARQFDRGHRERSDNFAIDRPDWYDVGGGEAGYVVPDPRNPDIVYAGSYTDSSRGSTRKRAGAGIASGR